MRFFNLAAVSAAALVTVVGLAPQAAASELTGVYEVHRICTVRPADKKTTGSKDKLFAKIQEGEILVRDDPRLMGPEKRLFAQILDQNGGRFLYEGLLDIGLKATPDHRAFNEFDGSLVACSAVRKHQPLDYLELIELKGVTGGNLVSWAVPSWVLGPVPPEERRCKYIFAETKEPAIRAKFPKDVPPCLERPKIPTLRVTAGFDHTCALLADGSAQCWGRNNEGQLGDNNAPTNSPVPVDVIDLGGKAIELTAGEDHTCALLADGSAQCWGDNDEGQLGVGDRPLDTCITGGTCSLTPVAVGTADNPLGGRAIALTAGESHTCALLADGTAQCWGRNVEGQLGNGTNTGSNVPVDVVDLGGKAIALITGDDYTCALLADGTAQCWGYNLNGQLGNGSTTNSNVPVDVGTADNPLGGKAIALAAGILHTCALLADGSTQCWGNNSQGQLGNGTATNSNVPVDVGTTDNPLGGKVIALTAGRLHTCALLVDGSTQCWGGNEFEQLGVGDTPIETCGSAPCSLTPVGVVDLGGKVIALAAGGFNTCAVLADGSAQCWGFNSQGQLGVGDTPIEICGTAPCSSLPVDVVGLPIELP